MQSISKVVAVLATGGTIAGRAATARDNVGYSAAQVGVDDLVSGLGDELGVTLACEQVAQLDSKDMDVATWQRLALRIDAWLGEPHLAGLVVTHGTDTLEETAWFLHRVLQPSRPVVLTAAMRPATSRQADGPQNLADALSLATHPGAKGVMVAVAGQVHGAGQVRKRHTYRLDAFSSGDAGPVAVIEEGRVRPFRAWPEGSGLGLDRIAAPAEQWPWVEIVTSHAGARGAAVDALVAAGVQGLVVAGTGNATVHHELAAAIERARAAQVAVRHVSRCADGPVMPPAQATQPEAWLSLSPAQARVELVLELLAGVTG